MPVTLWEITTHSINIKGIILVFRKKIFFLTDCKRNSKWLFIQRWHCPIYNGTFYSVVWSSLILFTGSLKKKCESRPRPHVYIYMSEYGFKDTVVNRKRPSLHRGSLQITLTPLTLQT